MLDVKQLRVKHVLFEYVVSNEDVYIFNTQNERMVKTTNEMIEYLGAYKTTAVDNDPDIDTFIFGLQKRKPFELKIKGFSIPKNFLSAFLQVMNTRYTAITLKLLIVIGLVLTPLFLEKGFDVYSKGVVAFNWQILLILYLSQIVITMLHELGHYYYYQKYIASDKFRFGFLLRYFFLFMFYTNVNFMDHLPKKKQLKILTAGIQTQLIISGILCIAMLVSPTKFLLMLFFLNLLNIVVNVVPFLKTDGYWLINLLIGSEDYMQAFKSWIKRKNKTIRITELCFAVVNIGAIGYVLFTGLQQILRIFLK